MSNASTGKPPSPAKRARLAAAGRLPYEPAAVQAAALAGVALLAAIEGADWLERWSDLLRLAMAQPGDRNALLAAAGVLLLRTTGSLLGATLLCGWGMGWLMRRATPPAAQRSEHPPAAPGPASASWARLLAPIALATVLLLAAAWLARAWMVLPYLRPPAAENLAGGIALVLVVSDLTVGLALFAWRRRRFEREEAMGRAEEREEAAADRGPESTRRAVAEARQS